MTDTTTELVSALASLSLHSSPSTTTTTPSILQLTSHHPAPPNHPQPPFPLLSLPAEIRVRIYEAHLTLPDVIDLDPKNHRTITPRLALFQASKQVHAEASHVFYSTNTFRLYPVHGRFFHTKKPLLARLPAHYRAHITALELRLGPGWTAPPACWAVAPALGLAHCAGLRRLDVFIECDPAADAIFAGFRKSERFYTDFCALLVKGIVRGVPARALSVVRFDAWESVKRDSPLLEALVGVVRAEGRSVTWGPERHWGEEGEALARMVGDMMRLM